MVVTIDATATGNTTISSATSANNANLTVSVGATALVGVLCLTQSTTNQQMYWDHTGSNQAMTLITSVNNTNGGWVYLFGLVNPVAGNKTLFSRWTSTSFSGGMDCLSFNGTDTTFATAFQNANTSSQNAAVTHLVMTGNAGNISLCAACENKFAFTLTATSSTTLFNITSVQAQAATAPSATSLTWNATPGTATGVAMAGVDISAPAIPPTTNITYIVGNGIGSYTPRSTVTATIECWGAGQASGGALFQAGAGGGWSKLNSFSLVAGTPIPFSLGAPGAGTQLAAGGDTWFSSAGTIIANGGGSSTPRISSGNGVFDFAGGPTIGAGGACSGGSGSGGPKGPGNSGGTVTTGTSGGAGGGGSGGGFPGIGGATSSAVGCNGGDGYQGVGGIGGLANSNATAGGLGAGGGGGGYVGGAAGPGGDDYDYGGGGGGGESSGGTVAPNGQGGTPGGGGGATANGSGFIINSGGWGLIKIVYTGTDADQIIAIGNITTIQIPKTWTANATGECWGAGAGGISGAAASGGSGGGSGAYASNSVIVTAGGTLSISAGFPGVGGTITTAANGNNSTISTSVVVAAGGRKGTTALLGGIGGTTALSTGSTKFAGAAGGTATAAAACVGGGGAGVAGPDGAGVVGAAGTTTVTTGAGGRGDNSLGGLGGATAGATNTAGKVGADNILGGGGGSGSGGSSTAKVGGAGGWPGAGGGGGGGGATTNTGGTGNGGAIRLTSLATILAATTAVYTYPILFQMLSSYKQPSINNNTRYLIKRLIDKKFRKL